MVTERLNMDSILDIFAKHVFGRETLKIVLGTLGPSLMGCYIQSTLYMVIYVVWYNMVPDLVPSANVIDQGAKLCQSSIQFGEHGLACHPSLCFFKEQLPPYLVKAFFSSATHVK